ncbi:hypothetical protein [Gluconobacter kondonii]|uniref:hypothetical protein n=1 Tax=Gluconobacter kondonii TaxID=941463 RepID=UPI001B8C5CF3|nr:hypothetical protein [Gluconobacter kondonii]MBS1079094.1 hypothetical protein [Gluconobacter kondonii]
MLLENKLRDLAQQKHQNDVFNAQRPEREKHAKKSFDRLQEIISLTVEKFVSEDFTCDAIDMNYDNSDINISTKKVSLNIYGNIITITPTPISEGNLGLSAVISIENQSSRQKKSIMLYNDHGYIGDYLWKMDTKDIYPSSGIYSIEEGSCFLDALAHLLP